MVTPWPRRVLGVIVPYPKKNKGKLHDYLINEISILYVIEKIIYDRQHRFYPDLIGIKGLVCLIVCLFVFQLN